MTRRLPTMIALACALFVASLGACIGTPGRAVDIPVIVRARPATEGAPLGELTTRTGWHVVLDAAHVALSALRALPADGSLAALGRALVPLARAHGGHGAGADGARAELLGAMDIDALQPDMVVLGVARGTTGPAGSLALELGRFGGTGGAVATLSGRAERDGTTIEIAGELWLSDGALSVEGLPLDAEVDDDGALVLEVRVDRWLDQAHFDRLAPATDGGPTMVRAGSQVALAWELGLRDPLAFAGSFEEIGEN